MQRGISLLGRKAEDSIAEGSLPIGANPETGLLLLPFGHFVERRLAQVDCFMLTSGSLTGLPTSRARRFTFFPCWTQSVVSLSGKIAQHARSLYGAAPA